MDRLVEPWSAPVGYMIRYNNENHNIQYSSCILNKKERKDGRQTEWGIRGRVREGGGEKVK